MVRVERAEKMAHDSRRPQRRWHAALLLAAGLGVATQCAAASIEREFHLVVTIDATQDWKKNDPKHPGDQHSHAVSHDRWEVRTRLRSDGVLQVHNLLDPDLNERLYAKTILLAREAQAAFAREGKKIVPPRTDEEKDAFQHQMEQQIWACNGEPACDRDMNLRYAALMAAIQHPEMLEPDKEPGQYLYFLPFPNCGGESRMTVSLDIEGVRFNKDSKDFVPYSEHHRADTINASDGLQLCEHYTAVIDTEDPKKNTAYQETIFIPRPVGTTDYTENGHTSHTEEPQPIVPEVADWLGETLAYGPISGKIVKDIPIHLSLNGNSTWLGLWDGIAKTTVEWSFDEVPPAPVPAAPKK